MPPIPAAPAALPAVHPFAPPGAPLPSPSTRTPVMPRTKLPIPEEDYEGQVSVAMGELRRIGSERLSLEQALLPGESPTTSPDMSPGSTEGDLAAPPRAPAQSAASRDSVRMLINQVDRELRQCGGPNGRGRLASVHPPLFTRLDAAMKSLGALRNAKRREDELLRRLRVVGQPPPSKPAVIAAAAEVSDALADLIESLWRVGNLMASLG